MDVKKLGKACDQKFVTKRKARFKAAWMTHVKSHLQSHSKMTKLFCACARCED